MALPLPRLPPIRGAGGTNWMSAIHREGKKAVEDSLHIAKETKEHSMAHALGKFMKANGEAFKALSP